MRLSVVIPLYNERENVEQTYRELKERAAADTEIVFVDDGSTDGTFEVLSGIAAKDPAVKVLRFRRNYGKTAALSAGFRSAQGEWIAMMDGDLQNDPGDIAKLLAKTGEGFDVVSGWRKVRKDPFLTRRLPSLVANALVSAITGVKLRDFGCALKVYRREFVADLPLYGEMHRFLPAYLAWNGARVAEIEVGHRPRVHGRSKYGLERIFKVVLDLLVAKFFFSYLTKPIYVFGGVSLASCALGAVTAGYVVVRRVFWGGEWISPLIFVAFFLAGISVLSLLMGFLAEVMVRIYFETRGELSFTIKEKLN